MFIYSILLNTVNNARNSYTLSDLHITLGNIATAIFDSQRSINFADQSKNYFYRISRRAACAYTLHQAGQAVLALELFKQAEQLQRELQPKYPRLYSRWGFYYCDFLLAQNKMVEVLERAQYALELSQHSDAKDGMGLLDIALDQLSLGRANFQQGNFPQAALWLDRAVVSLRKAGQQDDIPLGLLARAALYRDTRNPKETLNKS
ncbi:MAG: hypothetical protein IPI17_08655 [Nitrosomonas sp.]|nr:hypothetical protein [Nitrosomonas sp.]